MLYTPREIYLHIYIARNNHRILWLAFFLFVPAAPKSSMKLVYNIHLSDLILSSHTNKIEPRHKYMAVPATAISPNQPYEPRSLYPFTCTAARFKSATSVRFLTVLLALLLFLFLAKQTAGPAPWGCLKSNNSGMLLKQRNGRIGVFIYPPGKKLYLGAVSELLPMIVTVAAHRVSSFLGILQFKG